MTACGHSADPARDFAKLLHSLITEVTASSFLAETQRSTAAVHMLGAQPAFAALPWICISVNKEQRWR